MKSLSSMLQWSTVTGAFQSADAYTRGRPGYPPEVDGWLRKTLEIKKGTRVLDLGAGTGKFTQRLLDIGAKVTAVEPEKAMRDALMQQIQARSAPVAAGDFSLLSCRAEELEHHVEGGSIDAVVCAQAFHLFANVQAMAQIHRVLKPSGRLGLIWNLRDASQDWVAQLAKIVARHAGDHPRYYDGEWRKMFPCGGFSMPKESHFQHHHRGTPDNVIVNRIRSISFIADLPQEQQSQIIEEVRQLIASHPALAGQAEVSVPYNTVAFHAIKILPTYTPIEHKPGMQQLDALMLK
ncbi:class I SAM-dependent methyltransferase [Pseudomonas sp. nanlin1]|uniref:class I SAM-dependent methyltransferase n=1 Tax=Pseudomonas sp. nanlin1 TaxID=3040605 RepID=UPI00388FB553